MRNYNVNDITKAMGERLVIFWLMKYLNWDADYVDYVGADIIAIDRVNNKKYAISVKTKNHETDGHSCSLFTTNDAEHLREFASEISNGECPCIPVVAYVIVKLDRTMCMFLITLDDMEALKNEGEIIRDGKKGYLFVYGNQHNPDKCTTEKGKAENRELDKVIFSKVLKEKRIYHVVEKLESISDGFIPEKDNIENTHSLKKEMYGNQQGDFGESLVVYNARKKGMRAFLIKGEGVDVILQKISDKKIYAVSVKTFSKEFDDGYEFERSNVEKLREYSEKWGFTPLVSAIFVIRVGSTKEVFCYTMRLDYIAECAKEKGGWIKECKGEKNAGGYRFVWNEEWLKKLKESKDILFDKIVIE